MTDTIQHIPLDQIKASFGNDRQNFDLDQLQAFADGTRNSRQNLPAVTLRRMPDGHYQLIAGERRTRSARILFAEYQAFSTLLAWFGIDAGDNPYTTIRAEVRAMTDVEALDTMLAENEQRVDLDPVEQGKGYQRRLDAGQTLQHIASVTGRSIPYIERRLAIIRLNPVLLGFVAKNQLAITYAEIIANRELDNNRQLIAVRQFNACTHKSDEVLKDICAKLAEQQALDSQVDLFGGQLVMAGTKTRQEWTQTLPAKPAPDFTPPVEADTPRKTAEAVITFWLDAADQWDRLGFKNEKRLCAAAADSVRALLPFLPDHNTKQSKRVKTPEGKQVIAYLI